MTGIEFLFALTLITIIGIIVYFIPEEIFDIIVSLILLPVLLAILGILVVFWVFVSFFRTIRSLFQK